MPDSRPRRRPGLPQTVWTLGVVSLLMDTSSELIHSLLPVFLVSTLGASVAFVGLVEGLGEATASIAKVFSGWLSDRLGQRKLLTVMGYGLAALSKPLFALAAAPNAVLAARFIDRVGKGVRGAPRDALIADVTPPEQRGESFGVRQALDTVGAFAGPLLAMGLMALLANNIRAVFWWSVVPGIAAVGLLLFGVKDSNPPRPKAAKAPIGWSEVQRLGAPFWGVVALGAVFSMARFSEAFLILRAKDAGLGLALTPMVFIVMNLVYAAVAGPAGVLSDRIDRRRVMAMGLAALIAADAVLAFWFTLPGVFVGIALWGLHLALTQGLLAALVADTAPPEARGTAFGVFNLVSGLALLLASGVAGLAWEWLGAAVTFKIGGGFAIVTLLGLMLTRRGGAKT